MEVIYRSTRSNGAPVTASQAILKGLSDDGGLFVPDHIPTLDKRELSEHRREKLDNGKLGRCNHDPKHQLDNTEYARLLRTRYVALCGEKQRYGNDDVPDWLGFPSPQPDHQD